MKVMAPTLSEDQLMARARRLSLVFLIGIGLAIVGNAGAAAQAPPAGSYLKTCNRAWISGNTLRALCPSQRWRDVRDSNSRVENILSDGGSVIQGRAGQVHLTTVALRDYRECTGDIWYFRDTLNCQRRAAPGQPPSGSYKAICRDIRVVGADLLATCRLANGSFVASRMRNYQRCTGDIAMIDGRFRCNN
jgi:hypothetical protein